MTMSLTPKLEKYIQKPAESERYPTARAVVRPPIRMMQEHAAYDKARLVALRQDIQIGLDQLA